MRRIREWILVASVLAFAVMLCGCGGQGGTKGGTAGTAGKPPGGAINWAIAYVRDSTLYVGDFTGANSMNLTSPKAHTYVRECTWSPDGKKIAFLQAAAVNRKADDLYIINADKTGLTLVRSFFDASDPFPQPALAWSAEGNKLVYPVDPVYFASHGGVNDIAVLDMSRPSQTANLLGLRDLELGQMSGRLIQLSDAALSPDTNPGNQTYEGVLAFAAWRQVWNDNATPPDWETVGYVIAMVKVVTDAAGSLGLASDPGLLSMPGVPAHPAFSRDAAHSELAFEDGNGRLMAVGIDLTGPAFSGTPTDWTPQVSGGHAWHPTWVPRADADGKLWIAFHAYVLAQSGYTWLDVFRACVGDTAPVNITNTPNNSDAGPDWNPAWDPSKP